MHFDPPIESIDIAQVSRAILTAVRWAVEHDVPNLRVPYNGEIYGIAERVQEILTKYDQHRTAYIKLLQEEQLLYPRPIMIEIPRA